MDATPPPASRARAGLSAALGALGLTLVALVGSVTFLWWRGDAQLHLLDARKALCEKDNAAACDLLRSACLKKSAESCASLGNALLDPGPRHDAREGVRFMSDACAYRQRDACYRAGTMLLRGAEVPKDETDGRRLLERACRMGIKDACGVK